MNTGIERIDERSARNLVGVHDDLIRVMTEAADHCPVNFVITEGLRTVERQRKLVNQGVSWTMNSRHITGHAVDVAALIDADHDGEEDDVRWEFSLYRTINEHVQIAANDLIIPVKWGGEWKSMDGPHFELPRYLYTGSVSDKTVTPCNKRLFKYGSKGPCVELIQRVLNEWLLTTPIKWTPLLVDGDFGRKTTVRTKTVQRALYLLDDGVVGPKTWKALKGFIED